MEMKFQNIGEIFVGRGLLPAVFALYVFVGTALGAEEKKPSFLQREMTWEQCLSEAAKSNPDLRAAYENVRNYDAQRKGSYSEFFPQVTADAGRTDNHTSQNGSFGSGTTSHQYSASLNLQQTIFDGFKTKGKVDQAIANYQVSLMGEAIEKSTVSYSLKGAFAQLLYAQELVELTEKIAAKRQRQASLVEMKYEGGQENKGSYLLTDANYQQALFEARQAKRNLKVSQRQLAQVLGRITATDIRLIGELKTKSPEKEADYVSMVAGTPTHLQSEASVAAARAGTTIARSEFYPTVAANGSLFRQDQNVFPKGGGWQFGVTFSLPIFDGALNYFDVKAAEARYRQSLATRQSTDDQIVYGLEQTYNALLNAIELVASNARLVTANEVRSEIAEAKYSNGLITFQEYEQIEDSLISQQKNALQSRRDAVIAEANWELAKGVGDIP